MPRKKGRTLQSRDMQDDILPTQESQVGSSTTAAAIPSNVRYPIILRMTCQWSHMNSNNQHCNAPKNTSQKRCGK
ncbi:unnamed protein product [Lupinus luteus]|uniref:Uncharacterized protein n=1 Tax=Lupinus luteus TaxID=3873 RepID=A0AAV1W1U3_LUPLU